MQIKKVPEYTPDYPKKNPGLLPKLGAAAAAAILLAGSVGCTPKYSGYMIGPEGTEEAVCTEVPLSTQGVPVVDDTQSGGTEAPETDPPALMGDVAFPDP